MSRTAAAVAGLRDSPQTSQPDRQWVDDVVLTHQVHGLLADDLVEQQVGDDRAAQPGGAPPGEAERSGEQHVVGHVSRP